MLNCERYKRSLNFASAILATVVLFAPLSASAQDKELGFFERFFGRGDKAPAYRVGAENIAWKADLIPELYDGDYRTCVPIAASEKLEVGSTVMVHFDKPAKITGASVYIYRQSEEGDIKGRFLAKRFGWFSGIGRISNLGTNTQAGVTLGRPTTSSDLKFEINQIDGPDANVCLTEFEVYGSLKGEKKSSLPNAWLEGNWLGKYSNANGITGNTILRKYVVWPNEQTASTGSWNIKSCYTPAYNAACGTEAYTISSEGKIHAQYSYGFMGHWGGEADLKQVAADEVRGRWNYQDRYGGAVVWKRVRPEITKVTLRSDVTDVYKLGTRPGRVEKTYDGYWWGASVSARANRPVFWVTVEGKNLWGRHHFRIEPESDLGDLVNSDIELRGPGQIKQAGYGPPSDVVGLKIELLAWAGATPGRKILYVDDIAIPFDFVVHGYPGEKDIVWPKDATTPENLKEVPPKVEFVSTENEQTVLSAAPLGKPFRVRMTFDNNRDEDSFPVNLRTRLSGAQISTLALRTDNPKIYLSEPILSAPSDKWNKEVGDVSDSQ